MEHQKRKRLGVKSESAFALSEQGVVEATIEFANGVSPSAPDIPESSLADPKVKGLLARIEQQTEESRELCRTYLANIVSMPTSTSLGDQYLKTDLLQSIKVKPYFRKAGDGFTLDFRYEIETITSLAILGGLLLEDPHRGFRKKLCQCQLESCGKFFFKIQPPKGAPQKKYCCKEHMLEAHDLDAANRMKKRRRAAARKK
jgi:hypothetical protein